MFRPNVQRITIKVNGVSKKTNVCTECIRSGKIERG
jgi:large subunit ribosomal protein L28